MIDRACMLTPPEIKIAIYLYNHLSSFLGKVAGSHTILTVTISQILAKILALFKADIWLYIFFFKYSHLTSVASVAT